MHDTADQRRTLLTALGLNVAMFAIEVTAGVIGGSIALVAEGLDNLTDAAAYGIAMLAITRGAAFKAKAATVSGLVLLILGIGVLAEVGRRAIFGGEPEGLLMLTVAALSLVVNGAVLRMLHKYRHGDVHLRATWIFTRADVIANLALMLSGAVILFTGFAAIDLVVGGGIGGYVIKEALEILTDAKKARASVDG